jgi:uncharacterized DUF497 family protein
VEFEWDPEKAESNSRKHGVLFTEATSVFIDSNLLTMFDDSGEEERYIAIDREYAGRILFVVYANRGETIRLISPRKATAKEREEYEKRK